MKKLLEILTPENVHVEYELAGMGSRFAAVFIDTLIQFGLSLIIYLCIFIAGISPGISGVDINGVSYGYGSIAIAIGIVLIFIVTFGYYMFFEMIMNGQTPGKKVIKLRVIKQNGEPIGFIDSFIRNVVRIVDMLPSFYLIGTIFVVFSKNYMRLGDFAANTVVVKVRKGEKPVSIESLIKKAGFSDEDERLVNVYPVTNYEYGVLKEFLDRRYDVGARRPVFAFHLNKYFMEKFNIEKQTRDPYDFFEDIIRMNSGV